MNQADEWKAKAQDIDRQLNKKLSDLTKKLRQSEANAQAVNSRCDNLEDEKKELKEFQEKDKERRCLEYAVYQRELEEVGEALEEIEEERRGEVHNSNVRREQFNDRQKQVQVKFRLNS